MATKLEERIAKSKEHTAKLERLRRAEIKKQREIQKKNDQRRNYIVGELVTKYFPDLTELQPGNKSENIARFEPLESFLSTLAADKQLVQQIKKKAASNTSVDGEKCHDLSSDYPECVSGPHTQKPETPIRGIGGIEHG